VKFASLWSVIDRFSCNKIFDPALGGGEIVDLPPIPEHVRRDILRDPEPARTSVTAVLDYQMTGVFNVSVA